MQSLQAEKQTSDERVESLKHEADQTHALQTQLTASQEEVSQLKTELERVKQMNSDINVGILCICVS